MGHACTDGGRIYLALDFNSRPIAQWMDSLDCEPVFAGVQKVGKIVMLLSIQAFP